MKVPVYRSQTQMLTPGSAPQLTVRASPSALSVDSRALASFGDELANQAASLYERVLKEQRQTALNEAETELDLQVAELKQQTLNEAPSRVTSKGPKGFRARADKLVADLSAGMEDSVVQKRFNNRAKVTLANAQIVVNNNARLRAIDASKAAEYARIKQAELKLARPQNLDVSDQEKIDARLYLYGIDGEGNKVQPSIFQKMADRGLIKRSAVLGEEAASKEREAITEVRSTMVLAKATGDPSVLSSLVADLLQGEGKYKDIDPAKAITLANQVLGVESSLQNQQEADDRAAQTSAKAAKTEQRRINESTIAADLMNYKLGNSDMPPNFEDIAEKARRGEISAGFANTVTAQLIDGKPIVEDKVKIIELTDKIERTTSTNPDDYTELYDEVKEAFTNQEIDVGTFSSLYNRIETQRNSTISSAAGDRTSEEKFYAARVSEIFGFTEEGVKIPGFTFEDDAASSRRATDAKIRFRNLVDRFPNRPVLELFRQIEMENMEAKERKLPFMAFGQEFMDTYFPMLDGAGVGSENFKEATSDESMRRAEDAIAQIENGQEKVRAFEVLKRLRQHLAAMQNRDSSTASETLSE